MLPRWLVRTAAYCVAWLVLAFTVWLLARMLAGVATVSFAVVAALLLSALLMPVADALARLRCPRWLGALLSVALLVCAVLASVVLMVDRATQQLPDLQRAITQAIDDIRHRLTSPPLSLSPDRIQQMHNRAVELIAHMAPSPAAGGGLLLQLLSGAVLALFVLFFLLKDGERIWSWFLSWVPAQHRARTDHAGRLAWTTLTHYVRGTVLVALIDAFGIGLAMFLLDVPLFVSLTLVTFIGAFVPIVGAFVSGAVAVVVALVTVGPVPALALFGAVVAVQQLEGNVLQPLIMGRALELHPVVIVVGVSTGGLVGGVPGAVVAVPLTAAAYRVVSYLAGRDGRTAAPGTDPRTSPPDPPDAADAV